MKPVDDQLVEKIIQLSKELPEEQETELLALLESWKRDERYAPRERYTDVLGFSSKSGHQQGQAIDVSSSGIFIESSGEFEIGEDIQLVLSFVSSPNPIRIRGTIVRQTDRGIGVRFNLGSKSQKKLMDTIIKRHGQIFDL